MSCFHNLNICFLLSTRTRSDIFLPYLEHYPRLSHYSDWFPTLLSAWHSDNSLPLPVTTAKYPRAFMGKSWPSRICRIWNTAQYWGTLCPLTHLHACVHSNMDKKNCSIFFLKSQSIFISISLCSQWKWSIIISTKLPEEWQTLVLGSRNTSITLNCQRIQCWDYTKCNTQNDTMSARCGETHTCATCCFA